MFGFFSGVHLLVAQKLPSGGTITAPIEQSGQLQVGGTPPAEEAAPGALSPGGRAPRALPHLVVRQQAQVLEEGEQLGVAVSRQFDISAFPPDNAVHQLLVEVGKDDGVSVELRMSIHQLGKMGKGVLNRGHRLGAEFVQKFLWNVQLSAWHQQQQYFPYYTPEIDRHFCNNNRGYKGVKIEPNHWVDLSSTSWPSEHTPNVEVPFLVYHNEYENGKLFGFNQDKYNQSNNWITAPEISFKSISKETWNALKFESYTPSTTAFKDVSVKYVESIKNDPNKADPITAYTTDAKALKPVNFDEPTVDAHGKTYKIKNPIDQYTHVKGIVEQTQKAFNKEFIEKNELYLNENSVKDAKTKPTDLSYLLKFDQSNENKAEISVSLDTIDLRFQELIMHIKLVNIDEHGNDVGINRATGGDQKSKLIFNSVSLKKYTENDLFVFPPQEMGSDAKIAFDTFTLSSKDLFFIRPTQMKHTGNSGTFTLQLKTDSPPKPVFVRVRFEIKNFGERKLKENASIDAKDLYLLHGGSSISYLKKDTDYVIKKSETKFFYTEFIENSYNNTKLTDSGLKLDFTITASAITPAKYKVYRVILDQGYPKYLQITGTLKTDKKALQISDSIKSDSNHTLNGPYRVLYITHSKDTVDAKLKITDFNITSVPTALTNPSTKTKLSLAFVNQKYEKAACVYDYKPTTDTNICTLPGFNRITDDRCNMRLGCSNIFEFQLPTSVAIPVTGNEKQFAPYQLNEPKNGQTFNLKVNRKPTSDSPKPDFCIPFTYSANVTALRVTVDGLSLTAIDYPVTPNGKFVDTKVCASWFTNNVDVVEKLVFSFVNQELDIDNHYVKFDDYTTITEENPYNGKPVALSTGIYIDNKDNTDDTLFFESQHWKFSVDPKKLSNSLVYTISANVLESFIDTPNTKNGETPLYYEVLRSRWIQIPKAGAKLKISLTYKSDESDKDKIVDSLIGTAVSSQGGIETPIDFKSTPLNILPNSVFGEYYQFKIKVVLNLTTVAKLKNDHKLNDLTLKIENFSINDPCVDNLNKLQTCHSDDGTTGHNRCIRMYTQTDYRPVCNCTENATGDFCEKIDHCKRDKRICGALKCTNDYIFNGVSCECVSPQEWNPFFKGCIDPQELVCEQNRRPHYEPNHNKKMKCVCLEGFVEVPLNATTTVTTCEPLNVCDPKHRRMKHFIPEKPCVSPNATCEAVGTKTQDKDYKCNCNSGFSNEHGVHESRAVCLPDAVCSGCQYRCKQSGNTFKCDEQDCDPIGFKFNTSTKKCDFDGKLYSSKFNCVSAELGADKKPVCKCLAGQALDPVTQKCVDHCDDSAKAACQARGAPICDFDSVKKVPVCGCKNTDIPYTTDQVNASNWKCMSKCDLLALPDLYEARCSASFEHCNTNYQTDLPLAPIRTNGPKTLPVVNGPVVKNDIFVFNVSKVDTAAALSPSDPTKGQKSYCSCNLGFNWDSKRCVPSSVPTHTISGFEFDLVPTPNIHNYIDTVKAAFSKLIATIVGIDEKELINTKCEKATDTTILCSTSFQSEMTNENIAKKLNTACVRVANDKNKCYYVVDPKQAPHQQFNNFITRSISAISSKDNLPIETYKDIFSSQETNILIHDSKTTRVETEDVCKNPKTCSQYAYSVCTHDKENIKPFECLCPTDKTKDFFQILGSEYVEAPDKNKNPIKLTMQTCGIADLCKTNKEKYGCTANDAHCHSQVELDEKTGYKGFTYCTCPNTGAILSDRSLSCKESCDGSCSNNTVSCGRDYLNIKEVICNCKEGFTGTKCEKKAAEAKKEAEASSSKAYLISTIVVSVIAAIALIGLAVLYFKSDPLGHNGDPNVITVEPCKANPDVCKDHAYSTCFPGPNNRGTECLCDPKLTFLEYDHQEMYGIYRMQYCRVKKDVCQMDDYGCKDANNATCHFEVVNQGYGVYKPFTFCKCKSSGLTLADRSLLCDQTCHGECINSDHCVLGQAGKDGKPTAVCNCKAGFSGEKCEKKVSDAKAVAETTQSTTGYIVAIVILSVVSVIALAGVGVLFWKSRR
ncbi:hypothetical protein TYRP_006403 [Tyrophagus putrescentiae]|nr:hypothetical protein TYRP_006403 [Tyrophagus putrescentiae]